ncbi:MAG: DUF2079 domain-containing protein [Polyangiaceae bacterium]|nr:DUF2079 domain-containing protein [Polyangiaceae bacterium]
MSDSTPSAEASSDAPPTSGDKVEVKESAPPTGSGTTKKEKPRLGGLEWAAIARSLSLLTLLGISLCSWFRLSRGNSWIGPFLKRNTLPIEDRNIFLLQLLICGLLAATTGAGLLLFKRKDVNFCHTLEKWAWFFSPLLLLPAIPIFGASHVWIGKHETLLPIVLFFGLICERLVTQALTHLPQEVRKWPTLVPPQVLQNSVYKWGKKNGWLYLVVLAALGYGLFMSYHTVRWHNMLGTATFDLGINNNLIYGGLEGKFNQSSVIFPEDPQKYIANHVKIGLYTLLPIYYWAPRAETLLVIQSFSLGLGAIPLFLFARRRIAPWAAALLALAYLSYYPMHGANFYEMKVVPTAACLVLMTIWAIDSRHFKWGAFFFLWALIMREDMPIPLAVIGVLFLLSGERPRAGFLMTIVATAWFILIRFKVMEDVGSWWFPNMYQDIWSAPEKGFRSVLKTLLSNPSFILQHIFTEKKFWYGMHLLLPLLFLPVRRWYLWGALVPGAILTLLVTNYDPPQMFSFQYVMHWSPYLFCAAAIALQAIRNENGRARMTAATLAMACTSLALTWNYGAFPMKDRQLEAGYHKIRFHLRERDKTNIANVHKILELIPSSASVASTEKVGAHLSSRVKFYTLRRGHHDVDFIVARKKGLRLDRTALAVKDALQSKEYGVAARYGEFAVLQRGHDPSENQQLIEEWKLNGAKKTGKRSKKRSSPKTTASEKSNDSSSTSTTQPAEPPAATAKE